MIYKIWHKNNLKFYIPLFLLAFLIRLTVAIFFQGHSDLFNGHAFHEQLINLQDPTGLPYTPFSYIFPYYFAKILSIFGINYFLSLKLISFASEIFLFISLINFFENKKSLFLFIFFNPFLIIFTGLHAQIDLWSIGFLFFAVNEFEKNNESSGMLFFTLSVLIKPIFLPLVIVFIFYKKKFSIISALIFIILFSLPFVLTNSLYLIFQTSMLFFFQFLKSSFQNNFLLHINDLISNIIILIFLLYLIFSNKKKNLILYCFLPFLIIIKGGFNLQYLAWLVPLLIYNKILGLYSSVLVSMAFLFLFQDAYYSSGIYINLNAIALNNKIFGNNIVEPIINKNLYFDLKFIIINFVYLVIFTNLILFLKNEKNKKI
jgi:hypothetical protein